MGDKSLVMSSVVEDADVIKFSTQWLRPSMELSSTIAELLSITYQDQAGESLL